VKVEGEAVCGQPAFDRAGRRPQVDAAIRNIAVDFGKFLGRESHIAQRRNVVFDLRGAAGSDQRARDTDVPECPGKRHVRQVLAALPRNVFRPRTFASVSSLRKVGRKALASSLAREPPGTPLRYLSVSSPCASGEKSIQPIFSWPSASLPSRVNPMVAFSLAQ
jgi:hypothetical protein